MKGHFQLWHLQAHLLSIVLIIEALLYYPAAQCDYLLFIQFFKNSGSLRKNLHIVIATFFFSDIQLRNLTNVCNNVTTNKIEIETVPSLQ